MKPTTILSIVAAIALCTACTTAPKSSPVLDVGDIAAVAENAAWVGTMLHLIDNPDDREWFELAHDAIGAAIAANDYDPLRFKDSLEAIPVDELSGDKGAIIVRSSILLWSSVTPRLVALDTEQQVKPVMEAVYRGITKALSR